MNGCWGLWVRKATGSGTVGGISVLLSTECFTLASNRYMSSSPRPAMNKSEGIMNHTELYVCGMFCETMEFSQTMAHSAIERFTEWCCFKDIQRAVCVEEGSCLWNLRSRHPEKPWWTNIRQDADFKMAFCKWETMDCCCNPAEFQHLSDMDIKLYCLSNTLELILLFPVVTGLKTNSINKYRF